jgi:hypothetical protein
VDFLGEGRALRSNADRGAETKRAIRAATSMPSCIAVASQNELAAAHAPTRLLAFTVQPGGDGAARAQGRTVDWRTVRRVTFAAARRSRSAGERTFFCVLVRFRFGMRY